MLPYSRKDPLPFPFFKAVTALRFSPDYLTRERQEFKEEGKPQVSLPFCPRGGCRDVPPAAGAAVSRAPQSVTLPLNLSGKLSARKGRTACAVRVPRSAGAEKSCRPVRGEHACGSSCPPLSRC